MNFDTTAKRSNIMKHIKSINTKPEIMLRKALWHKGVRYRKNYKKLPGCPDIEITRCRIAIFIDGDFWHARGHLDNPGEQVKVNKDYWTQKLNNNVARDKETNEALTELGWLVLRFWSSDVEKNLDQTVSIVMEFVKK